MAVRNALDEGMQPQATQILAHLPWGVMGGVETQHLSQQGAHEHLRLQTEQHQHAEQRLYTSISEAQRRSPFPFPPRWAGRKVG